MADPENIENTQQNGRGDKVEQKSGSATLLSWLAPALALLLCGGAGFAVSRLFGTGGSAQNVGAAESTGLEATDPLPPLNEPDASLTWYYDVEPVVVNLNEPNVSRYVRVTLTLELGNGMAEKDGAPFLDQRKPLLKNWLTLFMSNRTTEDIRGEINLRRVQTQIADMFNQGLFPDQKPCVKRVLFRELSIQ
jgi:flagellar basal body-associated protein FliL